MVLSQQKTPLTPEAYLDWERGQELKHEYLDGDVYAMSGAKDSHVTIAGNLFVLLRSHLRGGPCRVYMSDMKVRVEAANAFFYPDVAVTCDERDALEDYFKRHPSLVVEVLSESTAAYDRGRKFAAYRRLESLREYVLIDADSIGVEVFRRDESNHWVLYPFGPGETVALQSVGLVAPIEAFYEEVRLPESAAKGGRDAPSDAALP